MSGELKLEDIKFDGHILKAMVGALVQGVADALGRVDLEPYRQQIKDAVLSVFDNYVVPYDIPGVGPLVETTLESLVRQAIPSIVDSAIDQLKAKAAAGALPAAPAKGAFDFIKAS